MSSLLLLLLLINLYFLVRCSLGLQTVPSYEGFLALYITVVAVVMNTVLINFVLNSLCEWWTDLQGCLLLERENGCLHQGISLAAVCQVLQL